MDLRFTTSFAEHVKFHGDLDIFVLERVEERLRACYGREIVIDLRRVRLVSAAFIGALVRLKKRLPGSRIVLTGVGPFVLRVFMLTKIDQLFDIEPTDWGPHHIHGDTQDSEVSRSRGS